MLSKHSNLLSSPHLQRSGHEGRTAASQAPHRPLRNTVQGDQSGRKSEQQTVAKLFLLALSAERFREGGLSELSRIG